MLLTVFFVVQSLSRCMIIGTNVHPALVDSYDVVAEGEVHGKDMGQKLVSVHVAEGFGDTTTKL